MTAPARRRPVISAWTAISPFGYGREAFAGGVRSRREPALEPGGPGDPAAVVPGFDVRELFGRKKTRAMNRVSGLTVAAAQQLLADMKLAPEGDREHIGFVLGTTTGSAQSMMDLTRASITGEQPDHVEPAAVPGTVMNCAAGQAAIWHGLKGPNATIAAGRTTGLQALNYARRLLMTGRAAQVLCGAAEENSDARSWMEHHRRGGPATLGEGCAMFLLEPADSADPRSVLATLTGIDSRICLDGDLAGTLHALVSSLLNRSGIGAERVWAAVGSRFPTGWPEDATLRRLFGDEVTDRVPPVDLIGDTSAATSLFGLASVLSLADGADRGEQDHIVVTACDDDGSVAGALLRLGGER
ncbi:beta-ketoacyl synthase N-terminal-like domain-containing protein [Amycolatopsis sp. WGS_07]|uniref:beta-ketoacyl synthase N-terminal-like domain-containing protein n=1 Tax=Amycolatopsis sp. WGS_07 TaxID=3076764 RepID=UPI0038739CEB